MTVYSVSCLLPVIVNILLCLKFLEVGLVAEIKQAFLNMKIELVKEIFGDFCG